MKSWAVPKGPSFDSKVRRMAIHVEDHPMSYNDFEGQIPEKQYGAGKVIIWDKGTWTPLGNARTGYRNGSLKFTMHGHKLHGAWALVRMRNRSSRQDSWLLIKENDDFARSETEFSVTDEMPASVANLPPPPQAPHATKGAAPATLKPMLATLVDRPPADPEEWIYEVKYDGYRLLARIEAKGVRLITRNGNDWTSKLRHLSEALESMSLKPGWLDGEIVVLAENGTTSFQRLQNAFDSARTQDIIYFLFDMPYYDGNALIEVPLVERRAALQRLVTGAPPAIRFSEAFDAAPRDLVASACRLGLEGIIGKRRESIYSSRRSPDWIKLKCGQRQEFVVGGWTDPKGSRAGFGSLLLGVHDAAGNLVYAGKVGSGFNDTSLAKISVQLKRLSTSRSPFKTRIRESSTHWLKPKLVAEVTFSEWTADGHLRHPVFHALRSDKSARSIIREDPVAPLGPDSEEPVSLIPAKLKVSNPDRVVDASTGATKLELIRYYALVSELMMVHLQGRPVSLVKAPQGIGKAMFFQKHSEQYRMEGIDPLKKQIHPGHPAYLEIVAPIGLLSAAQMNVIEIHTWNATKPVYDRPDRIIFDLDPGAGVEWKSMQQAAELVRNFLEELKLPAFLKTSGGKGLHVVTPIVHEFDWDTVKAFTRTIVTHVATTLPQLFVSKSGSSNRVGKIFIDYLRNGFGATTVSAWSARARPGLGISVPVAWSELRDLAGGGEWSIRNAHERLSEGNNAWTGYVASVTSLKKAMKALGFRAPTARSR